MSHVVFTDPVVIGAQSLLLLAAPPGEPTVGQRGRHLLEPPRNALHVPVELVLPVPMAAREDLVLSFELIHPELLHEHGVVRPRMPQPADSMKYHTSGASLAFLLTAEGLLDELREVKLVLELAPQFDLLTRRAPSDLDLDVYSIRAPRCSYLWCDS